jgi:phospholipid:diacylglycerol acyltransferase
MASFLRRRVLGSSNPSSTSGSREETPEKAEEVRLAPVSKIMTDSKAKPKTRKRRNGLIFALGGLFGLIVAGFFAGKNELIEFPELGEFSLDSLVDVLPANLIKDVRDLSVSLSLYLFHLWPGSDFCGLVD